MTADEFRGFIANLVIVSAVIAAVVIWPPGFPIWGWVLWAIALWLIAPIIPYHPKPKPTTERREDERA